MNLTLDIGNTAVKWATFEGRELTAHGTGLPEELAGQAARVMVCASGDNAVVEQLAKLNASVTVLQPPYGQLPVSLDYKTPESLGTDRIADACGARSMYPGADCLIIDAGTCITVDYLDAEGVYHGGAIMSGVGMNLRALHTFTAKLPLIELSDTPKAPVLGRSTEECIVAGTLGAAMLALAGYVALYKQRSPGLKVLLTGGDAQRLVAAGATGWEHVPHLTLVGLNEIANSAEC